MSDFASHAQETIEPSADDLAGAGQVLVALRALVARHRLAACAVRCFDLVTDLGTSGCLALSRLIDDGVTAGCEGDVAATLTMLWLRALTGETPFQGNVQDLAPGRRTLVLAHCTIARDLLTGYRLRSHFESGLGVAIEGQLSPGPVTLARIGGADLRSLFVAEGELVRCESAPERCRTQALIALHDDPRALLERPLGNHHVLVRGHHAALLRDAHALLHPAAGLGGAEERA